MCVLVQAHAGGAGKGERMSTPGQSDGRWRTLPWSSMRWLNEPPAVAEKDGGLEVLTGPETDFWQRTSYGFVHDDGHFLGRPMPRPAAVEVGFQADLSEQFDQAGLMLRSGPELWLKAGLERSDGRLLASVVVTLGRSDWSVAPVRPLLPDEVVTVRASRAGDGVTVRLRLGDDDWQLLRVAAFPVDAEVQAGAMCCSPTRAGLSVRFVSVGVGPPDEALHET
jgi:regulation of enolase protein 1 (concanavalin A-like superfamily)